MSLRQTMFLLVGVVTFVISSGFKNPPPPCMALSPNRKALIVVRPPSGRLDRITGKRDEGECIAYRLLPTGSLQVYWRNNGWLSEEVYIADDGLHVVRVGGEESPEGRGAASDDHAAEEAPVLFFYERGLVTKSYTLRELVKDRPLLPEDAASSWIKKEDIVGEEAARPKAGLANNNIFRLVTREGVEKKFNATTGEMVGP